MSPRLLVSFAALAAVAACQFSPPAPSVVARSHVPGVETTQPLVWDSREELAVWVTNAVTSAAATVEGSGPGAVIVVDLTRGRNRLHGPDLDPPPDGIRAARVRYRWLGAVAGETISMQLIVRPPVVTARNSLAQLYQVRTGASTPPPVNSGNWIEEELTHHSPPSPPYAVQFAMMAVDGSSYNRPQPVHGTIEIDWIALVR